ncbi:MAG: hypothetical protein ACQEWV_11515 [Bacillota bacterium]
MTLESVARMIGNIKQKSNCHAIIEENEQSHDVITLITTEVTSSRRTSEATFYSTSTNARTIKQNRSSQNELDFKLVQSLGESQETKKLLLEVKEQIIATQEKKSWWQKLWKG